MDDLHPSDLVNIQSVTDQFGVRCSAELAPSCRCSDPFADKEALDHARQLGAAGLVVPDDSDGPAHLALHALDSSRKQAKDGTAYPDAFARLRTERRISTRTVLGDMEQLALGRRALAAHATVPGFLRALADFSRARGNMPYAHVPHVWREPSGPMNRQGQPASRTDRGRLCGLGLCWYHPLHVGRVLLSEQAALLLEGTDTLCS